MDFSNLKYRIILKGYKYNLVSDKLYISALFKERIGNKINWNNPKTFNEKLQIIKLYDRRPIYTRIADKIEFKRWVSEKIGSDYVVPLLGIYPDIENIDFNSLPEEYVIKCNHTSGFNYFKTKNKIRDDEKIKKIFKIAIDYNQYKKNAEWPYKNIKRRILVEPYIHGEKIEPDYKFYCFHGNPKYIQVKDCSFRFLNNCIGEKLPQAFYDNNWTKLPFIHGSGYQPDFEYQKPGNLDEMFKIAAILSEGFPFVRVDLFIVDGKIYVSELTFFPYAGFGKFYPDEVWDKKIGDNLTIENI